MFNGWPVSPSISRASQRQQRPRTNQVKSPRRPALKYHSQKSAAQKVENDTRLGLILLTPFTNLPRATLELTPRHPQSYPESPSKLPRVTLEVTPRNPRSYSAQPSKLLPLALKYAPESAITKHLRAFSPISHFPQASNPSPPVTISSHYRFALGFRPTHRVKIRRFRKITPPNPNTYHHERPRHPPPYPR